MASLFVIAYAGVVIGVSIYLLMLASRFVRSHERIAGALERIAHGQQHPR